mmetsp:Transcript_126004/g.368152  ORF Transcript_126004/g.368152 Transcript_126004/m.368152 type:complete len:212 (-) Transcript_126004:302-937(-)
MRHSLEEFLVETQGMPQDQLLLHGKLGIAVPAHAVRHMSIFLLEELVPDALQVVDLVARERVLDELRRVHAVRAVVRDAAVVGVQVQVAFRPVEATPDARQRPRHVELRMLRAAVALHEEDDVGQLEVLLDDVGQIGRGLVALVRDGLESDRVMALRVFVPDLFLRLLSHSKVVHHALILVVGPRRASVVDEDGDGAVPTHVVEPGKVLLV